MEEFYIPPFLFLKKGMIILTDYIGKYIKQFESGNLGSMAFGNCGYDWGLSCGSYQLTLRWGNCINFLKKYFPNESNKLYYRATKDFVSKTWPGSNYCSSPEEVKEVWTECYNKYGNDYFFECEYKHMKSIYYDQIKNKMISYIDLDKTNRAFQECFWAWAIARGINGAYKEFLDCIKFINIKTISHERLFDIFYDKKYQLVTHNRYKKGFAAGEREILRPLLKEPGIGVSEITSPSPIKVQKKEKEEIGMKYLNQSPIQCILTDSTCYKGTKPMTVLGVLWHSTGANNPTLKRYVQPSKTDPKYEELMAMIGTNKYNNSYNQIDIQSGLNAWIGKLADGSVTTLQTLPWTYRPWGCGSGENGSCNNGWIQFEICEDDLTSKEYFDTVYKEACELTAYLCKTFNIDPHDYVEVNGKKIPTILCHKDAHALGMGNNHGDVMHWFPKYGKNMETVKNDVQAILNSVQPEVQQPDPIPSTPITSPNQSNILTQEQFNKMMNNYLVSLAKQPPNSWSEEARKWCEENGIIKGDMTGNGMYRKFLTREEAATLIYRLHGQEKQ